MLRVNLHMIVRFVVGSATAAAFAISPQLAEGQATGALTQFASPNNCLQVAMSQNTNCSPSGAGLNGANAVAVSPDGNNVYVVSPSDSAIAEFTRKGDGTLAWIGCIADSSDSLQTSCTQNATATGIVLASAIAISPNGENVYVAGGDSDGFGDIAEFTRNADGTLTELGCIAEQGDGVCNITTAHGLGSPDALAVSPDGANVYVADQQKQAVTILTRDTTNGSLSESGNPVDDCIQDSSQSGECSTTAPGLSSVTGVVVSPQGDNVYTAGQSGGTSGSIAEFTRNAGGSLTPIGCLGSPEASEICGTGTGVLGLTGLAVSPDGKNVYTASQDEGGPIAEFSRDATTGALTQLPSPNDCIEEQGNDFGCGSTAGVGIGSGDQLVVSSDGANVYASAPANTCFASGRCDDVAEFARDATTGALSQLGGSDGCIQDQSAGGNECPGNENGTGLGEFGIAISPDANNVYVTGNDDIAEFFRGTHTLSVSVAGSGSGGVSDTTGAIHCPSACSAAYTTDSTVTLTATPASGSTFTGWGGPCSGTSSCQVTMNADLAVTATFAATAPPSPGAPTPVLTGAPTAVTDAGAGFSGSVNPEGLPTTVAFQYGLDKRYTQVGASGPTYTNQTPAQSVGSDFTTHGVGPVVVTGLVPNALYHVRLVAANSAGTVFGQDVTFTTATAPAPSPPTLGQSVNVAPVSGVVLVLINGKLVPITQLEQLPANVVIDSLHGTFSLTTSLGGGGSAHDAAAKSKTQTGKFGGAVVRLRQTTRGANRGLTTVMMVESAFKGAPSQAICKAPAGDAHTASVSSKVIQLLHASAHGKFATSGRYSAATVRGTVWTMIARCDGTLVRDITDSVVVTDLVRHKTVVLHAGQSYLAPGRRKT